MYFFICAALFGISEKYFGNQIYSMVSPPKELLANDRESAKKILRSIYKKKIATIRPSIPLNSSWAIRDTNRSNYAGN